MKTIIITLFFSFFLLSCNNNQEKNEADELFRRAQSAFENSKYDESLTKIDSIRKVYPKAIEVRKKAISLYQNVVLKEAQDDLARTDKALNAMNKEYEALKAKVDRDKKALSATAGELQQLTLKSLKRDSIKTRFDILCAKIHYIHKLQKTK